MSRAVISIVLSLLVVPAVQADTDYEYFSKVLQLENRWERLSARTIDKYLTYLGDKGLYEDFSSDAESKIRNSIRRELEERLSWDNVGEKVVATIMSECSDETLRKFAEAYEGKGEEAGSEAASNYLECATEGIDKSVGIVQEEFREAAPSIKRIAEDYRS